MAVINGIRAVAIYDPVTGTSVQIAKVVANTFDFTKQPLGLGERGPMGNVLDQADSSACRFQFIDDGTIANQLYTWRSARTRVSMVAVGHSVCVQWYEKDHFVLRRNSLSGMAQGRGDIYTFEMVREGHGKHSIYQQANLLAHLGGLGQTSWQEEGSTELAKGYTSTGAGTALWVDLTESQSITHNAPDHGIYADIVFPVNLTGIGLTLSADIVETHTDTSTSTVRIEGKQFGGATEISSEVDSSSSRASTTLSMGTGNTVYTIRVLPVLTPTGVTTSDDVIGGYPALRVDGGTTFIDN